MALATAASGQQTMTLKECMQHAVDNSIKMKTQKSETDDARIARSDETSTVFTLTFR
jgi:hypothetical protein